MGRRSKRRFATFALAALLAACGGNGDGPDPTAVDEKILPFVGTWDAEVFTVTSSADATVVDLMENGSFFLNVQPSGGYTASLTFGGIVLTPEIGQITVGGGSITLRPSGADAATSAFTFLQPDYLRLVGPTSFDFNFDDIPEDAQAFIELRRR